MDQIVAEIKKKKELSDIPDELVRDALEAYLRKNSLEIPKKEKEIKIIVKEIRAKLRRYVGQYQSTKSLSKKSRLLQEGKIPELLKTHASTKERISFYNNLKEIIKQINPKSVLDLGCGLNPLAIASPGIIYYAYEIKKDDLEIVSEFFRINNIKGKIFFQDIRKAGSFPIVDLTLMFKILDIIEKDKYNFAKSLLQKIKSKQIIASFSTKTLSGKPMNSPKRLWFEKILHELNYNFKTISSNNEIFYFITKTA